MASPPQSLPGRFYWPVHNVHSFLSHLAKCCCPHHWPWAQQQWGSQSRWWTDLRDPLTLASSSMSQGHPRSQTSAVPAHAVGQQLPWGSLKAKAELERRGHSWLPQTPNSGVSWLTLRKECVRHAPRRSPIATSRSAPSLPLSSQPWVT